ncbi:MAG: metallophosphoesterase family protein [Planctomycetota bacterium]|nr:metallophosphoesterase family protein [Planctomycetota bacterium]
MIALVSDLHANLEALDAVCADIAEKKVEAIFCLGDVVGYGPDPRACLDRAMTFDFAIMGNHDHAVFMEPTGFNTSAETAVFWTRGQLEAEADEQARRKRWEFLARMVPDEGEANMTRLADSFDLVKHVCFVGHTHLPGVFTETMEFFTPAQVGHKYAVADRKVIVNVGSVGQPRDLDPRACYVTVEGRDIRWHRVAYDHKKTMEKILATQVLDEFLANRLAEGR